MGFVLSKSGSIWLVVIFSSRIREGVNPLILTWNNFVKSRAIFCWIGSCLSGYWLLITDHILVTHRKSRSRVIRAVWVTRWGRKVIGLWIMRLFRLAFIWLWRFLFLIFNLLLTVIGSGDVFDYGEFHTIDVELVGFRGLLHFSVHFE